MNRIVTMEFKEDALHLIDQRKIPGVFEHFVCKNVEDVAFAIKDMVVRGAPAIGDAAAFGAVLAAGALKHLPEEAFREALMDQLDMLESTRPTAVNLMWAINSMREIVNGGLSPVETADAIRTRAFEILQDDIDTSLSMSRIGSELIREGMTILTHCNTGALAVSGYGTALGVIREAHYSGKKIFVYADETRPRLQGARLTAWELVQEEIPSCLIPDSAAATLIRDGKIDMILVGADRIARNGDTANKIGTFMLSVVAKAYDVPFYIVAPRSTIDYAMPSGDGIEIEERSEEEVTHIQGIRVAPEGVQVFNPAFDVTPWQHITGIITEVGIVRAPFEENLEKIRTL